MSFEKARPKQSCARCPSMDMAGAVWGVSLCRACHAEWHADARFDAAPVYAAAGVDFRAASEDLSAVTAEWTRRTRAWVAERKTRAA